MAISTPPSETPEEREARQDAELEAVEYATGIEQPSEDQPVKPIPVPDPNPTPKPTGNIGPDGVIQLFPDAGSTFYLDLSLDDPRKDPKFDFDGMNQSAHVTKKTEAGVTFFESPGNPVSYKSGGDGNTLRIGSYAGGGKGQKQTHNWDQNPDFLYNDKGIKNSEVTVYVRGDGDLGKHKSCAFKIHGAPPDATRSLFETVFPISSSDKVRANWNYQHSPYVAVPNIKQYFNAYWIENKWVGLKHIHVVADDKKSAHNQLYADVDPFDSSGKPNNKFVLMAEWTDHGCKEYKMIPSTWRAQVNKVRLDGYRIFQFTKFSDREIDFSGKQPPPPPPPPPPVCPPKQHWDAALGQCVDDTVIPPGSKVDAFGVSKIYDDAAGPVNNWSFTTVNDPRFYEQKPVDLGNGWLTYKSLTQGRIEVLPEAGLTDADIDTFDYVPVVKKGYLHKPRNSPDGKGDWGDLEITQAIRNCVPGSGSFESHAEIVRGGFRQATDDKTLAGKDKKVSISCCAMSYHNNVYPPPGSNRCKYEKDTKHTGGYTQHDPEFAKTMTGIDQVKGYIHKAIYYRVPDSSILGGYAMKLETYVSTDGLVGKTFKMLGEYLDAGKWGPTKKGVAASCGCPNEYPVHSQDVCCPGWRIDFMKSFEFGKLSIRSIDPKKKLV